MTLVNTRHRILATFTKNQLQKSCRAKRLSNFCSWLQTLLRKKIRLAAELSCFFFSYKEEEMNKNKFKSNKVITKSLLKCFRKEKRKQKAASLRKLLNFGGGR